MFKTWHDQRVRVHCDPGQREKILYSPEFDRNGIMTLKESGRENLYDFIQSHRDSVDLHKILDRFQSGDVGALSRVQGSFGDFSQFPQTYAELLNQVIAGEQTFNSLPLDVREKFGHSFHVWLAQAGSESWLQAMGYAAPTPPAPDPAQPLPTPAGVNNPSPPSPEGA